MPKKDKGLKPGSVIPAFTLDGIDGKTYSADQFKGNPMLLYFFRGTFWPNCRKQLVQLRENASKYEKLGVAIVVIVGQSKQAAAKWLEKNPMPFPFLIDEDRTVIKQFDVYNPISFDAFRLAHPSLFLIDGDGKIVYSYVSSNQFDRPTDDSTYEQVHALLGDTIDLE
jgi:peroxiredoxin